MTSKQDLGTLIVTGASRGIGAAIATLAGEHGYAVAVNFATSEGEATNVVGEIAAAGGRAAAIQADVSREQDIVRMFEKAERDLGRIKALVNNAAITGGFARVEEVTSAAIANVFAVNVSGTILCSREAVRRMSTAAWWNRRRDREHFFARGTHRISRASGFTTRHRKARSTASLSDWHGKWQPRASG